MDETDDRVREALAAHLDHLEMGGPKPDTSHLSRSEQEELDELIGALELTQGVAFGLGGGDEVKAHAPPAPDGVQIVPPELVEHLVAELRATLPPDVRIGPDTSRSVATVGGIAVADGLIVGTFGGRLRVWLLAVPEAHEIESNRDCLADLNRAFGAFPDTAGVVLVAQDLSCLIVRPEDCAPQINIPSGSLIGRGYSQPVKPVAGAVAEFLNELIPHWDPIPAFDRDAGMTIDSSAIGKEFASAAIDSQRGVGQRARKGNPKKDVLLALGDKEVRALSKLADGLLDGSIDPNEIESRIERLAKDR